MDELSSGFTVQKTYLLESVAVLFLLVGALVGAVVGVSVGDEVGTGEGTAVGAAVGCAVGAAVGTAVGMAVGAKAIADEEKEKSIAFVRNETR